MRTRDYCSIFQFPVHTTYTYCVHIHLQGLATTVDCCGCCLEEESLPEELQELHVVAAFAPLLVLAPSPPVPASPLTPPTTVPTVFPTPPLMAPNERLLLNLLAVKDFAGELGAEPPLVRPMAKAKHVSTYT